MPRRMEEEQLLSMARRGRGPATPPSMEMGTELSGRPEMPVDPTVDSILPTEADMMPDLDMPMEELAQGTDMALPTTAVVTMIDGEMVHIQDETGQERELPMSSFLFPPEEGMNLVQAEVIDIEGDVMEARVGDSPEMVMLPLDMANTEFEVGDYFWMPEPPAAPDMVMEEPMPQNI